MRRVSSIDQARGLAVVAMVAYHILFDLKYFGIMDIDLQSLPLLLFQRMIGISFLLIAGISISISDSRSPGLRRHLERALKLALVACAITLATWIFPHEGFITFGIIHLMALSALIGPLFLRLGKWNVVIGTLLIALGSMPPGLESDSPYIFWLGLPEAGYTALDYYPLIPWFGVLLIGTYLGQRILAMKEKPKSNIPFQKNLEWVGRNSLAIYIAHQPVLIGMIFLAGLLAGGR